jgi:hypothetical protein
MRDDRLVIAVTFDGHGYRTTSPEVPPVSALSLSILRKRIEAVLMPDDPVVVLSLDRTARLERDRRRRGGPARASTAWPR